MRETQTQTYNLAAGLVLNDQIIDQTDLCHFHRAAKHNGEPPCRDSFNQYQLSIQVQYTQHPLGHGCIPHDHLWLMIKDIALIVNTSSLT